MISVLGTIFYALIAFVVIVLFTIIGVVVFVVTAPFDKNRYAMQLFSLVFSWCFMKSCPLWRFDIEGRENMDKDKPYVVTCNHQSMLDITLLYVAIGCKWGKFVSKKEVYRIPFFGWVLWARNDIAIDRGASGAYTKVLSRGKACLKRGMSIFIFPEGTRSKDGEIHRFKESAFSLAKQADVEILPCVMNGPHDIFKGMLLRRTKLQVRILPPIPLNEVRELTSKELLQKVQTISEDKLREMRNEK